jgi:hypothetical protein
VRGKPNARGGKAAEAAAAAALRVCGQRDGGERDGSGTTAT